MVLEKKKVERERMKEVGEGDRKKGRKREGEKEEEGKDQLKERDGENLWERSAMIRERLT